MPKATKKIVKKISKKTISPENLNTDLAPIASAELTSINPQKLPNSKLVSYTLLVVVIGLLTYKAGPWLVPAIVDNRPVTRFSLWSRLEKSYGSQTLDDIINEKILDRAIASAGIKVDQAKIDAQIKTLETQFEAAGGLDEALKQRGLSRNELTKQIVTQLSVEELLADKMMPSEEEVKKQFDGGAATLYKGKKFEEVMPSITEELKQAKLRDAFLAWFADVKKSAKIKNFGL